MRRHKFRLKNVFILSSFRLPLSSVARCEKYIFLLLANIKNKTDKRKLRGIIWLLLPHCDTSRTRVFPEGPAAARRAPCAWATHGRTSSSVHYKESLCLVLRRALRYKPHCLDVMAVAPAACINYKWAVIEFLERLGGRFLRLLDPRNLLTCGRRRTRRIDVLGDWSKTVVPFVRNTDA